MRGYQIAAGIPRLLRNVSERRMLYILQKIAGIA
jgi:hypothetical protein